LPEKNCLTKRATGIENSRFKLQAYGLSYLYTESVAVLHC